MKLRNKKTGEVVDLSIFGIQLNIRKENQPIYRSLAELNAEWEDYKPAEPLIKDEKIRKAIRAWADANDIDLEYYHDNNVKFDFLEHRLKWIETSIEFNDIKGLECLEDGGEYSITELCGEEAPESKEPSFIDLDERIREKEEE